MVVVVGAVVVTCCLALDPQSSSADLGAGARPCPTQCVTGVGGPDGECSIAWGWEVELRGWRVAC